MNKRSRFTKEEARRFLGAAKDIGLRVKWDGETIIAEPLALPDNAPPVADFAVEWINGQLSKKASRRGAA